MNNSPKTMASALEELSAELSISERDFGGKVMIEGKDPIVPRLDSEVMPGKRSDWCDLTNPDMQKQFWELVKGADVWVNSCLNLESKGVSPQKLAAAKPGIICVELRCYGFSGPWAELNDVMAGIEAAIGMLEALRRRAREGGSYLVRASLARSCCWVQDFGLFPENELRNAGLPESMMTAPGLQARIRPEFDLPLVTATGPLGEVSVIPPQVEFSEFKLGPRFSGDPNGASKLDWSVFTQEKTSGKR